ncbi:glycosyltransferase [Candidatus Saccharibacteria bacterium]|nr:glycosyltransferase [Candidatus Saccharibacteria bacterium]
MASPLVSVVIPVFNTGASAKVLAEKFARDDYENLEILLIDDGSTDDSLKLLKALKDPKIKVFSKENGGPSSARNFGLEKSKGKYLFFIDSDDDADANFISKLVSEKEKKNVALVSSGYLYHRLSDDSKSLVSCKPFKKKKNESKKSFVLRALLSGRLYAVNNKVFDAETIRKNNLRFDESLSFAEDTKFVLDYLSKAEGEILFVPEPLYIYNFGTETSIVSSANGIWENWEKSFKNVKAWVGKNPSLREKLLLRLLRLRWRVSCLRSKGGRK